MDLIKFQRNCLSIDPWNVLSPIIEKHFNDLIDLTQFQLSEGDTANGVMPDYASEEYAHLKQQYVPTYKIYPTVDLRVTGDFYRGLKARIVLMGIEIESIDSKAAKLEAKYGSKIYVLNDNNLESFLNLIIDEFIEAIYKQLSKE
jgi:hypothetical protein